MKSRVALQDPVDLILPLPNSVATIKRQPNERPRCRIRLNHPRRPQTTAWRRSHGQSAWSCRLRMDVCSMHRLQITPQEWTTSKPLPFELQGSVVTQLARTEMKQ